MGKKENSETWAGADPTAQAGQAEGGWQGQQAGPQPGVMYQFVPGAGFVPVACAPGQWGCPPYGYAPHVPPFAQYGQAAPPPYGPQYGAPYGAQYGAPYGPDAHEAHHGPEHDAYGHDGHGYGPQGPDMGQMYGMMQDVMQGKGDPGKLLGLFQSPGGEFWKGAIVGAAAVMLFNSSAVKDTLAGVFGAMGGKKDDGGCGAAGEE